MFRINTKIKFRVTEGGYVLDKYQGQVQGDRSAFGKIIRNFNGFTYGVPIAMRDDFGEHIVQKRSSESCGPA